MGGRGFVGFGFRGWGDVSVFRIFRLTVLVEVEAFGVKGVVFGEVRGVEGFFRVFV